LPCLTDLPLRAHTNGAGEMPRALAMRAGQRWPAVSGQGLVRVGLAASAGLDQAQVGLTTNFLAYGLFVALPGGFSGGSNWIMGPWAIKTKTSTALLRQSA